jgi:hypothetical protein
MAVLPADNLGKVGVMDEGVRILTINIGNTSRDF